MKSEVWLYEARLISQDKDPIWQCTFDFEITHEQAAMLCLADTGLSAQHMTSQMIGHHQTSRRPCAVIPEVTPEVFFALEEDLLKGDWLKNHLILLSLDQPSLYEYLCKVITEHNELTALIGLIVYSVIESQIEANIMNEKHV